jgi:uncharacterized protein YjbI with pentapeptide repeats
MVYEGTLLALILQRTSPIPLDRSCGYVPSDIVYFYVELRNVVLRNFALTQVDLSNVMLRSVELNNVELYNIELSNVDFS